MTLKEKIVGDFMGDEKRCFTVFNTNQNELFRMYDEVVEAVKKNENFDRFLNFKGATKADGKIRLDRESNYIDPDDKGKKIVKTKVVFKYPVYRYFYINYKEAVESIKEKELENLSLYKE